MIRMIPSTSSDHAKAYFSDALQKSDYYLNDQELQGRFNGHLAKRLGLKGPATKDAFFALCENQHPGTGEKLTLRTNKERIVGYDINFHCPKSLSVVHVLSKDNHIMDAFQEMVTATMLEIEADSKTRIRKQGQQDERETGELIWADFVHQTARPVDGEKPDPHLHCHCFVFNATWDNQENKIKAGKFRDIKRDMPYYQARFHKRLADKMTALGYRVRRTETSFEIEGVPKEVIAYFSKRTDEIGRVAKEKGITSAKELDALGARTRSKKLKGYSMAELKAAWKKEMQHLTADLDLERSQPVRFAKTPVKDELQSGQCVDYALTHCFERASVMPDRRLLENAYRHAIGHSAVSLDVITRDFKQDKRLLHIKQGGRVLCTTKEILQEEKRMVELAREGVGKFQPLYNKAPNIKLEGQQYDAVAHVLTTTNQVSIIRGAAGAGKTTLMGEAVKLVEKTGKKVVTVAPSAQASRGVLKEEGFLQAETVARLLLDGPMQDSLKNQVLWVDEAGLLGTKDMVRLLELAKKQNARVILGGDTRQHASVVRGDALRVLNTVGGIHTAEVSKIYRQRNAQYRDAVADLSKGQIKEAFEKLDGIGAIKTVDPLNPHNELADDYVAAIKKGKSALVVSPTHKEGDAVTEQIRKKLRQAKLIGKKEIEATKLTNLNFTEAQKADWRNYKEGQVIQFNQHVKNIKRASQWAVKEIKDKQVYVESDEGQVLTLPFQHTARYDAYKKTAIGLSKGDKIKLTNGGIDEKSRRLNNGMMLEVISVGKKENIVLRNKISKVTYEVSKDFGHLTHAHCLTSHSSQGKTVDEIFIAQPASTFSATDLKQFYVSVSRGRDAAHIYTDDKDELLEHASEIGDRQSALELVQSEDRHKSHVAQKQRHDASEPVKSKEPTKTEPHYISTIDRDYEPGL